MYLIYLYEKNGIQVLLFKSSRQLGISMFGYLFYEVIDRQDLALSIQRVLKHKTTQNILLSISSPKRKNINREWKVDVNIELNNEL